MVSRTDGFSLRQLTASIVVFGVGAVLALIGAANLLTEGAAADLERRGVVQSVWMWPSFAIGFVLGGVGVVLLVAAAVKRGSRRRTR